MYIFIVFLKILYTYTYKHANYRFDQINQRRNQNYAQGFEQSTQGGGEENLQDVLRGEGTRQGLQLRLRHQAEGGLQKVSGIEAETVVRRERR